MVTQTRNNTRNARAYVMMGATMVVLVLLAMLVPSCGDSDQPEALNIPIQGQHTVARGEYLNKIADGYQVHRATMLLANEEYLRGEYDKVCGDLSDRYRNDPRRNGTFCNDRYRKPFGNTLVPGMLLGIPVKQAPADIQRIVTGTGKRVALVIDETGSMGDDIATVTGFYSSALYDQKRDLVGIWLYSDGRVRKIDPSGFVNEYQPGGGRENTHGALKRAADDSRPDTIILITDEPGDDWQWPTDGWIRKGNMKLPPVVATCLPDRGMYGCESNLRTLAEKTNGEYVHYKK